MNGYVLNVLQRENILSCPIVESGRFLGFVDVLDITGYILFTWKKLSYLYEQHLFPSKEVFDQTPIKEVLNFSQIDDPAFVSEDETLEDLIKIFMDPNCMNRLHRVAVVRESEIRNIISQSDVIHFAWEHMNEIDPNLLNKTVSDLGYLMRGVIMTRIDTSVVEALEMLFKNKVSGLALVDQDFKFCGNLSASDLRGMHPSGFHFFNRSTLSFLCKGVDQDYKGSISLYPTATFREVLQIVNQKGIHRVYITQENGYPLGVISLIDVIARLS